MSLPTYDVEADLNHFLVVLRSLRDSLSSPDLLTWKTVYTNVELVSHFSERLSSCLSTAKARKLVRFAAPRLVHGEHDDVVITILYDGAAGDVGEFVGAKAQEKQRLRLQQLEASRKTKVDLQKAKVERARSLRNSGAYGKQRLPTGQAPDSATEADSVVEEVVEEVEEVEEEEPEDGDVALTSCAAAAATSSENDPSPPPPPPPDDDDWDPPPPPVDSDDTWDAPPPPPADGDDEDDGSNAVPPPPPPPPPPDDGTGDDEGADWDAPPPPPPEE